MEFFGGLDTLDTLGTAFARHYHVMTENQSINLTKTGNQLCTHLILISISLGLHSTIVSTFMKCIVFPPLSSLKILVKQGKVISKLRVDLRKYPN